MTHMYVAGQRINVEAMRRDARRRAERHDEKTVIHHHSADAICIIDEEETHEVYGDD